MTVLHILKTGSTEQSLLARRGDFDRWFREGLGLGPDQAPVVAPHLGDPLPEPAEIRALLITGSAAMVTDRAPWSVACEALLVDLVGRGVPVLGVCYGHQLLAQACGGKVGYNPRGREIGTRGVTLTDAGLDSSLLAGLPGEIVVQATHMQSVLELPPGASVLARNEHDAHQAFALGDRAFGVQFHPEFDAGIIRGYLVERSGALRNEAKDPEMLLAQVRESDHGRVILRNFLASI